jgi:large subunit ribosomal protein L4
MVSTIKNFKGKSFLLVDVEGNDTLRQSVSNLYRIDYLPVVGLNVYDIVKHEVVMISKRSLEEIYARVL